MSGIQFQAWPKITRLDNEKMTVTEKIDGTNACAVFMPLEEFLPSEGIFTSVESKVTWGKMWVSPHIFIAPDGQPVVYGAQSRSKLITPESDNAGFAKYVWANSDTLFNDLGYGRHFGEWWGSGIQRKYGMERGEKFFSLFNALRWQDAAEHFTAPNLRVVPLLYHGPFSESQVGYHAQKLYAEGSVAAPGFATPEGVVCYLHEAKTTYKITDAVQGQKPRMPGE